MANEENIYEGTVLEPEEDDYDGKPKKKWASIMSFVFSLVGILLCCCCPYLWLLTIAALVLGIFALVKKMGGKGLAIAGVVISSISIIIVAVLYIIFGGIFSDVAKLTADFEKYYSQYQETGEVPEEFSKYNDPKYDKYWESMGLKSFNEFYKMMLDSMKTSYPNLVTENSGSGTSPTESPTEEASRDLGETPIAI